MQSFSHQRTDKRAGEMGSRPLPSNCGGPEPWLWGWLPRREAKEQGEGHVLRARRCEYTLSMSEGTSANMALVSLGDHDRLQNHVIPCLVTSPWCDLEPVVSSLRVPVCCPIKGASESVGLHSFPWPTSWCSGLSNAQQLFKLPGLLFSRRNLAVSLA